MVVAETKRVMGLHMPNGVSWGKKRNEENNSGENYTLDQLRKEHLAKTGRKKYSDIKGKPRKLI